MALNTVTLTWDLTDFLNAAIPDSCTLYLTPTCSLSDTVDSKTIIGITRSQTFSSGVGSWSGIVANDNINLSPSNSGYKIWVIDNATGSMILPPFVAQINHANGSTQDLSFLYANQSSGIPLFQYALQSALADSIAGTQFSVLAYGADPTGATDSTTALQAAQAAATAAGGGYVYYPPGIFKHGTISIPGVQHAYQYLGSNVHFQFSGVGNTVLVPNAANTPLFNVNTATYPTAAAVRFLGGFTMQAHASGSTGPAIDLTGARQFVIESPSYWDSSKGTSGTPGTYFNVIGLGNNSYANYIYNPICEGQHLGN